MSRETKVPSIPDVRDDNVKDVLRAIKATLEVREGAIGDPLDQGATFRDLVDLNLADLAGGGGVPGSVVVGPIIGVLPPNPGGYNPSTDYTVPPAPTGFRASGGFTNVFLEWDGAPYRNHAYTEIWRSQFDNIGTAVLIGTTAANVYADPANANTTYYYWVRFVSRAAVTGPFNSTSGTVATTALDVNAALTAISDEIISSQLFTDLSTRVAVNTTGIQELQQITATSASQVNTLASVVNGNSAAIEVAQQSVDGLRAQYSVKIDNNGYVSGFGLSSSPVNGVPRSSFIVRADSFAIAPSAPPAWSSTTAYLKNQTVSYTSGGQTKTYQARLDNINVLPTNTTYWNDITSILPFAVLTQNTVIDGVTYPAGTYIKTAFIADATITSAKIQSLVADKITTGSLTAAVGITTGRISGGAAGYNSGTGFWLGNDGGVYKFYIGSSSQNMRWDGTNLSVTGAITATSGSFYNVTVYNTAGQVILSSGSGINTTLLGLGSLAYQNTVDRSQTTGFGTLAGQNTVTTAQITGLGYLATQNDVFIGSTVKIWNGGSYVVLNSGDFVNALNKITTGNISTFIQGAAITEAYIGSAAISSAKIQDAAVGTAQIAAAAITAAKIQDAAIGSAKIENAAVTTLKIGSSAVTVPTYGNGYIGAHTLTTSPVLNATAYVSIGGLESWEAAGTIIVAYLTIYENGGADAVIASTIYVNGSPVNTSGCTVGESKTVAITAYTALPNGVHTIEVMSKTDPSSGGASTKPLNGIVTGIVVMSGKR